jgi:hypothetical protein
VAREDVRWMLDLVGARVIAGAAGRFRELGLDERILKRCGENFARALEGGAHLTRREMAEVLARGRIKDTAGRLMHILGHAEVSGIIVSGARRGKQPTFALLDHRAPKEGRLDREGTLRELAIRYFQSRGPATLRDFTWWTGLPLRETRLAIELARSSLESRVSDGETWWSIPGKRTVRSSVGAHLLPAFDEYLISYADRSAMLDPKFLRRVNAGGGLLRPAVVIDGQVVGTWTRMLGKGSVSVRPRPFAAFTASEREAVRAEAERYAGFLGLPLRGR